jgi:THO complex subunit 3
MKQIDELMWTKDGRHLMIFSNSGNVEVYRFTCTAEKYKLHRVYLAPGHTSSIPAIDLSKDGQLLATGGSDALVCVWDIQEMICLSVIDRFKKPLRSVSFSYDRKLLASAASEVDTIDIVRAHIIWVWECCLYAHTLSASIFILLVQPSHW